MHQGHLGSVSHGAEFDTHHRLVTTRLGEVAVGVMRPGKGEPLRSLDLDVLARRGEDAIAAVTAAVLVVRLLLASRIAITAPLSLTNIVLPSALHTGS